MTRCDTKGCGAEAAERVPDRLSPHVVYDLCSPCAVGLRALQRYAADGALVDARDLPPLSLEPIRW